MLVVLMAEQRWCWWLWGEDDGCRYDSFFLLCAPLLVPLPFSFFFMILPLFFVPLSPPGDGVFIRGRGRGSYPTPVQSWRRGRVAGAASVQLPQSRPQDLFPLLLSSWW